MSFLEAGEPEQLSLDGMEAPKRPTDSLFFALFPDHDTAHAIASLQRSERRTSGTPIDIARLHLTLIHIGDYIALPNRVVEEAQAAAAALRSAPIAITFDRLGSFSGQPGRVPFVLRAGDEANAELSNFQTALSRSLLRAGVRHEAGPTFTPHVTLFYGDHEAQTQPVAPLRWTAGEFVLVHSLLGRSTYRPLGRWPFTG